MANLHNLLDAKSEKVSMEGWKGLSGYAYALPITPHASFATEPFSLSREKNPGLAAMLKKMHRETRDSPTFPKTFVIS